MDANELPGGGQAAGKVVNQCFTLFGLLLVRLNAYFDLDCSNRHNLISHNQSCTHARIQLK